MKLASKSYFVFNERPLDRPKNNGRATGLINLAAQTTIRYSDGVARGSQDPENFLYVGQLLDGINLDEYNTVIVIENNVRPL